MIVAAGRCNNGKTINHYTYTDPLQVSDKIWYRIMMTTTEGKKKHSSIIKLKNNLPDFDISNIINPFGNSLTFNITIGGSSNVTVETDRYIRRKVISGKQLVYTGTNSIQLGNTQTLPSGIYALRVVNKDRFITKLVVKKN
ncbi:MAG: hypothetical protein ACXWV1_16045 [Chitinophagaceae bacterium]